MTTHKVTTVDFRPSAYELGKMFYKQDLFGQPFLTGTEGSAQFLEGWKDAGVEERRKYSPSSTAEVVQALNAVSRAARLKREAALARTQYHMA